MQMKNTYTAHEPVIKYIIVVCNILNNICVAYILQTYKVPMS